MDQLANDLSFAMIDVEDNDICFRPDFRSNPLHLDSSRRHAKDKSNLNSLGIGDLKKTKSSFGCKQKSNKPIMRSASILLRSKVLILSDSDSDEGEKDGQSGLMNDIKNPIRPFDFSSLTRKPKLKKPKRKKEEKEERLFGQLCINQTNFIQYFGKRKRSTTNPNNGINTNEESGHSSTLLNCESDPSMQKMDCDSLSCDSSSLSESICDSDHFVDADDEQSDFYEVISRSGKELPKPSSSCKSITRGKYSPSIPIPKNPFASVPSTPSSSYNSLTGPSSAMIWKRRRRNQ